MTFSERLRQLRLDSGLTQKQLADKSGISQSAIGHWESGARPGGPSVSQLFLLCDALGVGCEAFRGLDPAPQEREPSKRGRPQKPADLPRVPEAPPKKRKKKS